MSRERWHPERGKERERKGGKREKERERERKGEILHVLHHMGSLSSGAIVERFAATVVAAGSYLHIDESMLIVVNL